MPVTLASLVRNRSLGLILRSGSPDVELRWADISDQVDPTPYLEPGTMLLTTGLSFGRTSRRWPDYIKRIVVAGVPALGLGVGLRHRSVPEALLAAAGPCCSPP